MNRKHYQTPSMRVVEIHSQVCPLLNTSAEGPVRVREYDFDTFEYGE